MDGRHWAIDVLESFLTFLGSISIPVFTYLRYKWRTTEKIRLEELKHKEEIILHERAGHDIMVQLADLKLVTKLNAAVSELFKETTADTFLILIAANGIEEYRLVSVIYELEKDGSEPLDAISRYENLIIDNDYRETLYKVKRDLIYTFNTELEKDCLLKRIYDREGVVQSIIFYLDEIDVGEKNKVMVYGSVASKDNRFSLLETTVITMQVQSKIKSIISKLKDNATIIPEETRQ